MAADELLCDCDVLPCGMPAVFKVTIPTVSSCLLSHEVPSDIGAFVANSCGAYRFVVDWDVGDVQESGFVVQFMRVDISQDRCDDKKNECGCYNCGWNTYVNRTRQEYTEVWYVAYDRKKKKPPSTIISVGSQVETYTSIEGGEIFGALAATILIVSTSERVAGPRYTDLPSSFP